MGFQCSSASRKFLNDAEQHSVELGALVSVLFSEPKIPQSPLPPSQRLLMRCFSALQRAENSSMVMPVLEAERLRCFSALQRAENSSMHNVALGRSLVAAVSVLFSEPKIPQLHQRLWIAHA